MISIDNPTQTLLYRLSNALDALSPVGELEFFNFRAFRNDIYSAPMAGFIDGDLVERYLDLPFGVQHDIINKLNAAADHPKVSVNALLYILNKLKQMH